MSVFGFLDQYFSGPGTCGFALRFLFITPPLSFFNCFLFVLLLFSSPEPEPEEKSSSSLSFFFSFTSLLLLLLLLLLLSSSFLTFLITTRWFFSPFFLDVLPPIFSKPS